MGDPHGSHWTLCPHLRRFKHSVSVRNFPRSLAQFSLPQHLQSMGTPTALCLFRPFFDFIVSGFFLSLLALLTALFIRIGNNPHHLLTCLRPNGKCRQRYPACNGHADQPKRHQSSECALDFHVRKIRCPIGPDQPVQPKNAFICKIQPSTGEPSCRRGSTLKKPGDTAASADRFFGGKSIARKQLP